MRFSKKGLGGTLRAGLYLALVFQFGLAGCDGRSARLSWKDNSENEEGFRIYRTTQKAGERTAVKVAEVKSDTTAYVVENTSYDDCYYVTAFNSAGESLPTHIVCLNKN